MDLGGLPLLALTLPPNPIGRSTLRPYERGRLRVAEFCTQVYTDLERLFYLLNLREIMQPGSREPPSVPPEEGEAQSG